MVDNQYAKVYSYLQDRESKLLYEAYTVKCVLDDGWRPFFNHLQEYELEGNRKYFDDYFKQDYFKRGGREVVIFPAGNAGKFLSQYLKCWGIRVKCFCDNDSRLWNSYYDGIEIISFEEMQRKYKDTFIMVAANEDAALEIEKQLTGSGVLRSLYEIEDVVMLWGGKRKKPNQYFDPDIPLKLGKEEIFVDAGAFDGKTTVECYKWMKGRLKKSYLLMLGSNKTHLAP